MSDSRGTGTETGGSDGDDVGSDAGGDRVLILNPTAGGADHADRIRELARERGLAVRETEAAGDAIALAREAAAGASLVVAAGGDGTVNEVVRGIVEADALGSVTLGIVPAGTGNNFAGNLGIDGLEAAFEVLDAGEVRTIDLGFADGHPFLNSLIGGLTAEASAETTPEAKERLGVAAYVLATLRTAVEFDGLPLHIETTGSAADDWSGEAVFVLIGNARRFPAEGRSQADVEDGLLDVTVIEDRPAFELVGEAALERLLGSESRNVARFLAAELSVSVLRDEPGTFSLDGEMQTTDELAVSVRERVLDVRVGESYEPHPGG
jgi:YegS/Rv2252/BmrU family lipid kinase